MLSFKTTSRSSPLTRPSSTSSPTWSSASAPTPPPPSSSPSSVISSSLVNSLTSSASLPLSLLRSRHAPSESHSLSSTTICASISLSTTPMRWTQPQPCKRRSGAFLCEKMVEAASDKFFVVVDETKLASRLNGSAVLLEVQSGLTSEVVQESRSGGAWVVLEQLKKYIKKYPFHMKKKYIF
ncbi:hypothetical protein AHAS_Ahas09G0044500 [Arachis hypogaea]